MSGAFTDADYERMVRERDEAFARIDSQRSQISFYRHACTARFLPEGFGDETMRELIKELIEERDEARAMVDELRGQYQYSVGLSIALEERDQARRERDLALGRLENEIKAAKQARMAEERARDSLDELDAAIYECLPSEYDDDSPLDCVEHAADRLRDLAQERDEAMAELAALRKRVVEALPYPTDDDSDESRTAEEAIEMAVAERDSAYRSRDLAIKMWDEARAEAASSLAMARIADEKHDMKCAEADVLRGVGCMEDGDGPCGVCRKCAYRRGAEAMREACAQRCCGTTDWFAVELRALPIPEEP